MMRKAAAISDAGMLKAKDVIRPRMREADASTEMIIATLVRGANGKPETDLASLFALRRARLRVTFAGPRTSSSRVHRSISNSAACVTAIRLH